MKETNETEKKITNCSFSNVGGYLLMLLVNIWIGVEMINATKNRQHRSTYVEDTSSVVRVKKQAPLSCSKVSSFPFAEDNRGIQLVDHEEKLMLSSTSKGGATVSNQIMLRHWNLMEKALEYDPWVHNYRIQVLLKEPRHEMVPCDKVCRNDDWTCIKIVRSPLDRVVSSYIHTFNTGLQNIRPEFDNVALQHGVPKNATTFTMFLESLRMLAENGERIKGDRHFMPQASKECDISNILIPVEALEESLDWVHEKTGVFLNATGLTSSHYTVQKKIVQNEMLAWQRKDVALPDASNLPPPLKNAHGDKGRVSLPYAAYFQNTTINTQVCQLFCNDIQLYAKMCNRLKNTWTPGIQAVCEKERERTKHVCGEAYVQNYRF